MGGHGNMENGSPSNKELDEPAPKHVLAVLPSGLLKTAEAASLLRERCDENSSTQNS